MREQKFRFIFKDGNFIAKRYMTLDELLDSNFALEKMEESINSESNIFGIEDYPDYEVFKDEYTGLKDKNGVEIYEGDIVNFQHIDDYGYMTNVFQNGFYRGVVKWGGHYPAFDIFNISDNSTFGFDCNIFSMESDIVIEVIGNIYENQDLLKKI